MMENILWIVVLIIVGTVMLITGIGHLVAGAIGWGIMNLTLALLNYAVAVWRVFD